MTDMEITQRGAAWLDRPQRQTVVIQRISATRVMRHDVLVYADATAFDRMHFVGQLSNRQHDAAEKLYRLFVAAGLSPHTTSRYGDGVRSEDADEGAVEAAQDHGDSRVAYRRLLCRATSTQAAALDSLMQGQHPGLRWLMVCQEALDWLGDEWGMEKSS